MAKRRRIGLLFSYSEAWIAGTYYVLNIIQALKKIPSKQQPIIYIISNDLENFNLVKKETKYPYLRFVSMPIVSPKYTVLEKLINSIALKVKISKVISKKPLRAPIDFLYPFEEDIAVKNLQKVNWVPDFQEIHLPHLFTSEILEHRKTKQETIICKGDWVVFSSKDSQKDFNFLYPEAKPKQFVLPFAVTLPDFKKQPIALLLQKYNLKERYFFIPNQFWAHKNHMLVLETVLFLKLKGINVSVAFSGKENDHRNKDYFGSLKQFVFENKLEDHIHFLGFLPREDQLQLMKNAIAIVQPSKFEGWSTVVEDAKALGVFILVSSLAVHKEQINENAAFFNPNNVEELAVLLEKYWEIPPKVTQIDYTKNIISFANSFMELVSKASI